MQSRKDISELFRDIIENEKLNILQKKILLNEVRKLKSPDEDRWVYRMAVFVLGAVAIGTALYPYFVDCTKDIPSGLLALGSAAMGALAGYLTPHSKTTSTQAASPERPDAVSTSDTAA
jgi:hypothetical protein